MSDEEALWISEAMIVDLISLKEAIPALEAGLRQEQEGKAVNMKKTHAVWNQNKSTLHAIGAVLDGAGIVGTKTWAHTPGGACPLLILFNSENGKLMAVIEAFALGQMVKLLWLRTGWETNWHSVMEQTQGFLFGVGLVVSIGALAAVGPQLSTVGMPPWTSAFAVATALRRRTARASAS